MSTRYSPYWAVTTVTAAGEQAGSRYLSALLLALLGQDNLSQQFSVFRQLS